MIAGGGMLSFYGKEASLMKDTLTFIVQNLVDQPDAVNVTEVTKENGDLLLQLRVAPTDMGKVIGKQGRIAKAIRTLMKAPATKAGVRLSIDILD